jgi:hypothetical protein
MELMPETELILRCSTSENRMTATGDTFCFDSFVSHVVGYIEVVKSLKGILRNSLSEIVIVILLDFRPIPGDISQIINYRVSI